MSDDKKADDQLIAELRGLPNLYTEHGEKVEVDRDLTYALAVAIKTYVDARLKLYVREEQGK